MSESPVEDPANPGKMILRSEVEMVGYVGTVKAIRDVISTQKVWEPGVDANGIPSETYKMEVPNWRIALGEYAQAVRALHAAGFRLVKVK